MRNTVFKTSCEAFALTPLWLALGVFFWGMWVFIKPQASFECLLLVGCLIAT